MAALCPAPRRALARTRLCLRGGTRRSQSRARAWRTSDLRDAALFSRDDSEAETGGDATEFLAVLAYQGRERRASGRLLVTATKDTDATGRRLFMPASGGRLAALDS